MNTDGYKFVNFKDKCNTCIHKNISSTDEPCDKCLSEPANYQSTTPIKYEAADKKK